MSAGENQKLFKSFLSLLLDLMLYAIDSL